MSLLLNRQLQVHLRNTIIPLHPQIKQKEKNPGKKQQKKPHPRTFNILQQQKERKSNFAMHLHHLFTSHALKLNKYGFSKSYINKNKIHNYAESSVPFQPVFKKKKTKQETERSSSSGIESWYSRELESS